MTLNRQPQSRTIESDTIDFLKARVTALEAENLRLHRLAYPEIIEVVLKPQDKYPACQEPLTEKVYG